MRKGKKGLIFILLILSDQLSKYLFFLGGNFILNKNTSWGIFSFNWWWIIILLAGMLFLTKNSVNFWGISLFIIGGISNLIDRVFYGGVIDFIDFGFFPSFNLADVYICFGLFIIVLEQFKIVVKHFMTRFTNK